MRKWNVIAVRCEKARGPDRGIDAAMAKALGLVPSGLTPGTSRRYEARFSNSTGGVWDAPDYTDSLDAITALIDRELPDGLLMSRKTSGGEYVAALEPSLPGKMVSAQTEPLARCAAFARAMNEKEANA